MRQNKLEGTCDSSYENSTVLLLILYLIYMFNFAFVSSVVGLEASSDTVESAAAFLFDVFSSVPIVGSAQTTKLRNIFGPFPASAATKACTLVNKVVSWLPEEVLELLGNQDRQEAEGEVSQQEFGKSIKFSFPHIILEDYVSDFDSDEEGPKTEVDLKYSTPKGRVKENTPD